MDPFLEFLDTFRHTLDAAAARLRALPEAETAVPRTPGGWSAREILGHLIDSAANNHARFVRAQFQADLHFPGYDQDAWVRVQDYASAPWAGLVDLWEGYNRHLLHVIARIPEAVRTRPRARHNLHRIAWRSVPPEVPATLDDFVRDYHAHLRHHLAQILGEEET